MNLPPGGSMSFVEAAAGPAATDASASPWRRWIRDFATTALLLLIAVVLLNLLVNPAGYYPTGLFPVLTANDVAQKRDLLLRQAATRPAVLLLGSSKTMRLSPRLMPPALARAGFNAATSAAVPTDMLEMARYAYDKAGIAPRIVLVGVDVEMFHNGIRPVGHLPSLSQRAEALFSVEQTSQSLRSLGYRLKGGYPAVRRVLAADGTLQEPVLEQDERRGVDVFARDLPAMVANYHAIWSTYTGLSASESRALSDLVALCRAHGSTVVLFLSPTHPRLEAALRPWNYDSRKQMVRAELEKIAAQNGARFLDLSDVQSFGGNLNDFYDGVHVKDGNAERMLQRLLTTDAVQ